MAPTILINWTDVGIRARMSLHLDKAPLLGKAVLDLALDLGKDDIFTPSMAEQIVTDKNFRFPGGKLVSGPTVVSFKYEKNKCDYSVKYSWRLSP